MRRRPIQPGRRQSPRRRRSQARSRPSQSTQRLREPCAQRWDRSITIRVMETPLRWRELFQEGRGRLTIGILLVEFLVAVEALVIIAIMPAIRLDLAGLECSGIVFPGLSQAALVQSTLARWSA